MIKVSGSIIFLIIYFHLTACGGGRGSNVDTGSGGVVHKTPDGIWHGSINTTDLNNQAIIYNMDVIISNGQFFAATSSNQSAKIVSHDLYTGAVVIADRSISGQLVVFLSNGTNKTVSINGNVSEQSTLSGTIDASDTFSLSFDANYNRPVSLVNLSGTWNMPQATITPLTITGDKISGKITADCTFSGTLIQPNPSNNAFTTSNNLNAKLTGASCLASGVYTSIVTLEANDRLVLFLADTTYAFVFVLTFVKQA